MYVNTPEMKVLDIDEIRKLVNEPSPSAPKIESECRKALLLQHGSTDTQRAELLFWYAEAVGSNQLRELEAAPYAARAAELAYTASPIDYVLVVQARSLYLSFIATTQSRADFQNRVQHLANGIERFEGQLSREQQKQIDQRLLWLKHLGRNLTGSRLFADMR